MARRPARAVGAALTLALTSCAHTPPPGATSAASPLSVYYSAALDHQTSRSDTAGAADHPGPRYGDLVARCMEAEGFEFWPHDEEDRVVEDLAPTSESVSLVGYGIVGDYAELDPFGGERAAPTSPEDQYLAQMTQAERDEYDLTLYGPIWSEIADAAARGDDITWDWERAGCEGQASHAEARDLEMQAGAPLASSPYDGLVKEIEALAETVDRTPEWAEVVAAWSSCMARSGYDVSSWDDAYEQIATALDTMISAAQPELVGSGDTVWVAPGRSGLPDPTEYQALQQRERDTASADLACRQEVDAEGERATILVSLEEDFLEENRGQLDAMLDWFTVFG